MTSPRGRRLGWAQLSARADPPAGVAAAARGSKGVPVTRDSRPSLLTLHPISPARGAGRLPPLWDRLQAPLSRSSLVRDRGPSLLPTDPLPTPPCRVSRLMNFSVIALLFCKTNKHTHTDKDISVTKHGAEFYIRYHPVGFSGKCTKCALHLKGKWASKQVNSIITNPFPQVWSLQASLALVLLRITELSVWPLHTNKLKIKWPF